MIIDDIQPIDVGAVLHEKQEVIYALMKENAQLRESSARVAQDNVTLTLRAERDYSVRLELERERDEARAFGIKAAAEYNKLLADQRVLTCAFCGEAYPEGTPATQHKLLSAHVEVCPKHPIQKYKAEVAKLRIEVDQLKVYGNGMTEEWKKLREERDAAEAVILEEYESWGSDCSDDLVVMAKEIQRRREEKGGE